MNGITTTREHWLSHLAELREIQGLATSLYIGPNSFERFGLFADLSRPLSDRQFWFLLGQVIPISDMLPAETLKQLLRKRDPSLAPWSMSGRERRFLQGLEEPLTIYRGCREGDNEYGYSWTLDRTRAEWFAREWRMHLGKKSRPLVLSGVARRTDILACFLGRGEQEVFIDPDDVAGIHWPSGRCK